MIIPILRQQLIGTINLALPVIILYQFFPGFVLSTPGILLCSLLLGSYIAFMTYRITKNQADSLKFIPSDRYLQMFHQEILQCKLKPQEIPLRYAYTDDGVAMTLLSTIAIDPMLWKEIDDIEFINAQGVIEKFILPGIPESKKVLHAKIKEILSPNAQRFIFKHELGHIFYNYAYKRIIIAGMIGATATLSALCAVNLTYLKLGGLGSLALGIGVGAFIDLLLSYLSNAFFKAREEKKADIFAAQFSSKQEIEDAAYFFEQYEKHAQEYRKTIGGLITIIPTIILSGYINGLDRAKYLRKLSNTK